MPKYVEEVQANGELGGTRLSMRLSFFTAALTLVILVLYTIAGPRLNSALFGQISSEGLSLVFQLSVLLFPLVFLQLLGGFLTTMLQTKGDFFTPMSATIIGVIGSTAFIGLFGHSIGIASLIGGQALNVFIVLVVVSIRLAMGNRTTKGTFKNGKTRLSPLLGASIPLAIGSVIGKTQPIIERRMSSGLPAGAVSTVATAGQIVAILSTLVSSGVGTVVFPRLARESASGNLEAMNATASRALTYVFFLLSPLVAILATSTNEFVKLVFERGAFDSRATEQVSETVMCMVGVLVFGSLGTIIAKLVYVAKPVLTGSVALLETVVFALCCVVLVPELGANGIALSYSLGAATSIMFSIVGLFLSEKISRSFLKSTLRSAVMFVFMTAILSAVAETTKDLLGGQGFLQAVGIMISVGVGFLLLLYPLSEEARSFTKSAIGKIMTSLK